jgi:hypothetical protein
LKELSISCNLILKKYYLFIIIYLLLWKKQFQIKN